MKAEGICEREMLRHSAVARSAAMAAHGTRLLLLLLLRNADPILRWIRRVVQGWHVSRCSWADSYFWFRCLFTSASVVKGDILYAGGRRRNVEFIQVLQFGWRVCLNHRRYAPATTLAVHFPLFPSSNDSCPDFSLAPLLASFIVQRRPCSPHAIRRLCAN